MYAAGESARNKQTKKPPLTNLNDSLISIHPDICTVYAHSAPTMLRYLLKAANIGFWGRPEGDELLTSGDLHFRRFVPKCASRVRVRDESKHRV